LPNLARLAAFAALLVGLWWARDAFDLQLDAQTLRAVDRAWTPRWIGAYLLFWVVANSILWPTLAGGVLFGVAGGTGMGLVGAALAAAVQLVVIRTFLQAPAEAWLGERLVPLQTALHTQGLGVMVVWRLLWLPVSWLTVAAAVSRVPLWQHVGTVVAMAPGMFGLCLMADSLVLYGPAGIPATRWAMLAAIVVASLAVWAIAQRRFPALAIRYGSTSAGSADAAATSDDG